MVQLESLGEVIETDVLVIGGGVAGLWCALTAKDRAPRVTVVDKGFVGRSGHSPYALAGSMTLLPGDNLDASVKDLLIAFDWLMEQDVAEYILANSWQRIKDMESMGVEWFRHGEDYVTFPARGTRILKSVLPTQDGGPTMLKIKKAALHKNVEIINRVYISDLLVDDGKVVGAVGTDTRSDTFKIFKAKATVIATNTAGFKGHYFAAMMVGDGPRLAYQSGAEITNAEFDVINTGSPYFYFEPTSGAMSSGAKLRNVLNEAFMEKYQPELKDRANLAWIARATATEVKEGKGPLHLDFTSMQLPLGVLIRSHGFSWRPLMRFKLERKGIKFEKPEWMACHFYNLASLKTSFNGAANLPGLFAAGKARSCGVGILSGWSYCSAIGTGFQVGKEASEYAMSCPKSKIDTSMVASYKSQLYEPLNRKGGTTADAVVKLVQQTVFPYDVLILKSEDSLKKALGKIEKLQKTQVPAMAAGDIHDVIKVKEAESVVLNAEMMLRASLMRKESRFSHFREDYPQRDDVNWLKWVVITQDPGGRMALQAESMPMDRYKYSPSED